ncbi:MAG: ATP-binding cassette domain-containing protein, partial [Candidatus Poseidoniales archaeon]
MMFEIRNGAVQLGDWVVFEGLNLRVEPGEIVSILGPSGCGKTTLLRASCGLERLKEGQRLLNDEVLENATIVPIITMLFQQPVLYPHLNVAQNIGLGAPKTMSKMAVKQRVDDVLQSIGLADFQRRGTAGLSGGEAQRVAFGRALMQEPTVMLLDEPFASVDVKRRLELSAMTRSHLKERNITTV